MTVEAIVAVAVGTLAILGAIWRLLRAGHRWANAQERMAADVTELKGILNNGIRSDLRETKERSGRAEILAADAARAASVMQQHQEEIGRAVNALRGEVDIYTNVVLSDRQRIREALRDLGKDIGDDD